MVVVVRADMLWESVVADAPTFFLLTASPEWHNTFPSTIPRLVFFGLLQKGGDPAAPSGTATLLRLSPNHRFRLRRFISDFGRPQLSWLDGRCVQGPGTYSPWYS